MQIVSVMRKNHVGMKVALQLFKILLNLKADVWKETVQEFFDDYSLRGGRSQRLALLCASSVLFPSEPKTTQNTETFLCVSSNLMIVPPQPISISSA
jgi:hypothetical protein